MVENISFCKQSQNTFQNEAKIWALTTYLPGFNEHKIYVLNVSK